MDTNTIQNSFATADYLVFGLLILISIGIGIFFACYGKGQSTTSNYFLGGRQLKVVPVALSFVVSFQSSIMILGFPAETYAYGMQIILQCIGIFIAYLFASVVIVPFFHPMKLTSVYEYFQKRYENNVVRFVAVAFGLLFFTFYMGVVTFGAALAMQSAAGLPFWVSVVIFSSSAILYTSIGGMKAVVWTDVFQSIVMLSGILAITIKCSVSAGGLGKVFEVGRSRLNFFNFNPDPTERHTFWTLIIGAIPQFLYISFSQPGVQRINSTPTVKQAKQVYYVAAPVFSAVWMIVLFEGLIIYAYYFNKGCDPIAAGMIPNVNQIMPYTVMELFRNLPGVPGLFISALAAASLSTISSGLSSVAAITYVDIIKVHFANIDEKIGTNISKATVVLFGLISVGFAFLLSNVKIPLSQIIVSFMGATAGPINGLFLISIFFYRTTPKGAVIGTLCGFVLILWIIIGQNFSGAVKPTPYLPLGPTDQCFNRTGFLENQTWNTSLNESVTIHTIVWKGDTRNVSAGNKQLIHKIIGDQNSLNESAFIGVSSSTSSPENKPKAVEKSALQTLYSISYMYFNLIGMIITVLIGIAVSLMTQPKTPPRVDKACILPLSVLVPSCIRNRFKKNDPGRKTSKYLNEHYELEIMIPDKSLE